MNRDYIFQNAKEKAEYLRLQKIEELCDRHTQNRLGKLGMGPGKTCLEVGPGAGSIMKWLCQETGSKGHVTAIDLCTRFLQSEESSNLTLIEGNITQTSLKKNQFDYIHARYVLIHILDYEKAVRKMLAALKPGGWIFLEEPDFTPSKGPGNAPLLQKSFMNIREAIKRMYIQMGLDPTFGAKLPVLLKNNALEQIGWEIREESGKGSSTVAEMMKMSALHLKAKYIQTGAASETDIENYCHLAENPQYQATYYATVSAWGQKPYGD